MLRCYGHQASPTAPPFRVFDLEAPGFDPSHLPPVEEGEFTFDLNRGMYDGQTEAWDEATQDYLPIPPAELRLTLRGWMSRFTPKQQEDYQLVLEGYSPVEVDEGGEPALLGRRLKARAKVLSEQLHAGDTINPTSALALQGLQALASLQVIAEADIPLLHVPVTTEEVAQGLTA